MTEPRRLARFGAERRNFRLLGDEFHNFMSARFVNRLAKHRGYRLSFTLA